MKKVISNKFGMSLVVYIVLAAGLLLSLFIFLKSRDIQIKNIKNHFDVYAADRTNLIINGLLKDAELLQTIGYFYASSETVERSEFHDFTKGMVDNHPEIYEFRWLPKVTASERAVFKEAAINEKLEDFYIKEPDKDGNLIKSPDKELHFPIFYVEPENRSEDIIGLDAYSISDRREAMQIARDTGSIAMVAETKFIGKSEFKAVSRVFLPIYANKTINKTAEERRAHLIGFVTMLYNTGTLIETLLKDKEGAGVDIYVYGKSLPKGNRLVAFHSSHAMEKPLVSPIFGEDQLENMKGIAHRKDFKFANVDLTIICRPTDLFLKHHNAKSAWGILGICLFAVIVLTMYLNSLTVRTAGIEKLVAKRTEELKMANKEWIDTFNSISDFIFILDKEHKILKVNSSFLSALKLEEKDVVGKRCYEIVHKLNAPWPGCPHEKTVLDNKVHTEEVEDPNLGVPFLVSTSPIFNEKGEVAGSVHIARDISEQKKNKEELNRQIESLERFQKVTVGRELRMKELKAKIAELESKA